MAKDIVEAQKNSSFLEIRQLQLIAPFQFSKKKNLLPPFFDYKIGYDYTPWDLRQVKDLFAKIMNSNVGVIKFLSTHLEPVELREDYTENEFVRGALNIYRTNYLEDTTLTEDNERVDFYEFKIML